MSLCGVGIIYVVWVGGFRGGYCGLGLLVLMVAICLWVGCDDVGLLDLVFCVVIMVGAVVYALVGFGFGRVGFVIFTWGLIACNGVFA